MDTLIQPGENARKVVSSRPQVKKAIEVGRILSVGSSMVEVNISGRIISANKLHLVQLGTVLKIITHNSIVVAMVSSLEVGGLDNEGMHDGCLAKLNILGEITTNTSTRQTKFFRGVRSFPVLNQPVMTMIQSELDLIFSTGDDPSIVVGRLQQDNNIVARVRVNDLLSKHFAIIGSTGSGKSCTVALVLQAILKESPNAHVVLFDPHNEYSHSFGDMAAVTAQADLDIPIWLFDFEETAELLTSEIADHKREEIDVLSEIILKAKQLYDQSLNSNGQIVQNAKLEDIEKSLHRVAAHISLDSPVPYRMRDVLKLVNYYMGRLENSSNLAPYKRLERRMRALMADPRYNFIFKNQAAPRSIQSITGDIFRIPVAGKPISILDFSGIPAKALNIVVSVVSRLAFELAMWSKRNIPILLVCEEAHRYIPADPSQGFNSTRKSISRIAKEGRKYGVSLGIISQRPSELEPSTLSQCSTIFSMRLSNERDQEFVKAAIPDGAAELLAFLPSLGTAETMVFGESVNLPMRVVLDTLAEELRPHSSSAEFTDLWSAGEVSPAYMDGVFENWRKRSFEATPDIAARDTQNSSNNVHLPTSNQRNALPGKQHASARQQGMPLRQSPQSLEKQREATMMRHRAQDAARAQASRPKIQIPDINPANTIADVKRMLNSAFHKNI